MKHRWMDVQNEGIDSDVADSTIFAGGTELADLWIVQKTNVLICQYEDDDEYVSYFPISAVLDHAKGRMDHESCNGKGMIVQEMERLGLSSIWGIDLPQHKPEDIARYLAVFYPDAFTEAQRQEALGITLTTEENDK